MKNKKLWLGMLVLSLVLGFTVLGCDLLNPEEETFSLQGKWDYIGARSLEFIDENFEAYHMSTGICRGTFTYTSTSITFYPTHYYDNNNGWVDWDATQWYAAGSRLGGNINNGNPISYVIKKVDSDLYLYFGENTSYGGYRKK